MDQELAKTSQKLRQAARAAHDRRDSAESERLALEAAVAAQTAGDERGRVLALTLAGAAKFRQGRLAEAEDTFRSLLEYEPELGRTLNNLARVVSRRGRPVEALHLFERALHALGGSNPVHDAIALDNIGVLFFELGLLDEAWASYELADARLGDRDTARAWETRLHILNNRGAVRRRQGLLDEAKRYYEDTLRLARARGDQRSEASAKQNLGIVAARQGGHDVAREHHERAYELRRGYGDAAEAAQSVHSLARVEARRGEFARAIPFFEQAYGLRRQVGDPAPVIDTLLDWGRALTNLHRLDDARARYEEARTLIEVTRAAIEAEQLRQIYLATVGDLYGELAALLLAVGEIESAFAASEEGRARMLRERLAGGRTTVNADLARQERLALEELATVHEAEQERPLTLEDQERKLTLRRELRRTQALLANSPVLPPAPAKLGDIKSRLAEGVQLASFVIGETRSFAFVITRDGHDTRELPHRPVLEAAVSRFRVALLGRGYDRERGLLLRRELFDPVAPRAGERLIIVPDGPLHDVPWAALPDEEGGFIAGRYGLSVAPAATTGASRQHDARYRSQLIAFAAPGPTVTGVSQAGVPRARARLAPLRHAVDEVETIARLFGWPAAHDVIVRTGGQASRDELLAVLDEDGPTRHIHLACHGLVYPDRPDLSGIALTAVDRTTVDVWRAPEFLHANLNCDLAVLSACDTATGPNVPGEGVVSLGHALLGAGARHACVALWPVHDEAAPELMRRFYGACADGLTFDLALARAQLEMVATTWRHPYFWAWPVLTQL